MDVHHVMCKQPILAQLACGQAVGTSDTTVPADGYQPLPIRQGDTTTLVARAWLAGNCPRTDPVGALTVGSSLVRVARGIPTPSR